MDLRGRAQAIQAASRHIPDYLAGRLPVKLARRTRYEGPFHIRVPNHHISFCGDDVARAKWKPEVPLGEALPIACPRCAAEFKKLLEAYQQEKEISL